jgi:hypothetical protein
VKCCNKDRPNKDTKADIKIINAAMINRASVYHLFACNLFNDTVSKSVHTASEEPAAEDTSNELRRMRKRVLVGQFKVLSQNVPE